MDELAGFRLLGDKWYALRGLPLPAQAKQMAALDIDPPKEYAYTCATDGGLNESQSDADAASRSLGEVSDSGDSIEDKRLGGDRPIDGELP